MYDIYIYIISQTNNIFFGISSKNMRISIYIQVYIYISATVWLENSNQRQQENGNNVTLNWLEIIVTKKHTCHISKNLRLSIMAKGSSCLQLFFCIVSHTLDICCLVNALLQVQVGTSSNEFSSTSNFRQQQQGCSYGHLPVITGYFYGIIHSINGVLLWMVTIQLIEFFPKTIV